MSVTLDDPLVVAYLARLDAAVSSLPEGRRVELVADLREHLAEALAVVPAGDVAGVQGVLDRLGVPEDIVAAERDETPNVDRATTDSPWGRWGSVEIGAVLALALGGFLSPFGIVSLVGVGLAWASSCWTVREKVVATLLTSIPLFTMAVLVVIANLGDDESLATATVGVFELVRPAPGPGPSGVSS